MFNTFIMNKIFFRLSLVFLIAGIAFVSCSKENQDDNITTISNQTTTEFQNKKITTTKDVKSLMNPFMYSNSSDNNSNSLTNKEFLAQKHNESLRLFIEYLDFSQRIDELEIKNCLMNYFPNQNVDEVYELYNETQNIVNNSDEFHTFITTDYSFTSDIIENFEVLLNQDGTTLNSILEYISSSNDLITQNEEIPDLEKSNVRYFLEVAKYSAIFWAPINQNGLGFYDLLNQKLNRVSSSEINYRSGDEEPCDYPFGSCVCGASETDGAVTCVCCATGSGSGSGSGSEGHGPGYWRKALAADSKTALGVVTVLGISAASPAGSVLAGAAAASTPAILASAGVTIGVSSLYGGLFN